LCDRVGALLLFDEVQTGVGRTGTFLGSEHDGISPDICTLAKGLGGGVAIGACLATDAVAASFGPGTHASTFGGNPLATAAAAAVVQTLLDENVLDRCRDLGAYFLERLQTLAKTSKAIAEVRGRGLLIGVELVAGRTAGPLVGELLDRGFLAGTAGDEVLRFAPPLTVARREIDALMVALSELLAG
jgi:acetylornithine/succinyldiaminopimelate/putrescine aminotransferase